jgi:hypothetical protein
LSGAGGLDLTFKRENDNDNDKVEIASNVSFSFVARHNKLECLYLAIFSGKYNV